MIRAGRHVPRQTLPHGNGAYPFVAAELLGMRLDVTLAKDFHPGIGLREDCAGREPAGSRQQVRLIGAIRVSLQGKPDVGRRVRPEAGREDADHGVRCAAQGDRFAHDRSIAAETALPQVETHHQDPRAARLIFGGDERAAQDGRGPQQAEVVPRDS